MIGILEKFKKGTVLLIENFKKEIIVVRGNRPSPALVENLKVDYFGQSLLIKQLGSISIIPPREIDINVWDKNAIPGVVKAVENSGLSANYTDKLIRINLPPLNEERRQELVKAVKKIGETFKIQLRNNRDEVNKEIGRSFDAKELNEDQKFKLKEEIQKNVDSVNQEIENILDKKIKELEEV
ncbi:MAG: ribosome-recycling factor [bacterium]|nr:ribosome-recycling factor [bacterium]